LRRTVTAFAPLAGAFREAGIELIAVSTDNVPDLKKSLAVLGTGEFPFPLVANESLDVFKLYRCYDDFEQTPLHGTFLIDADGLVRWQDISFEPFMQPKFLLAEAQRLFSQGPIDPATSAATSVTAKGAADDEHRDEGGNEDEKPSGPSP
jgi:peroxiredoxin